jgi:ribosomal protein S18 acetylase RimI-like enzyme
MPPGEQIADRYLERMFRRCAEYDGVVLVAETEEAVSGFVSVWTRCRSSEPEDDPAEHGYVSDLVVSARHRGCGIGRALLRAAEARVREAGVDSFRVAVKAGNTGALSLYSAEGFEHSALYLEKRLA